MEAPDPVATSLSMLGPSTTDRNVLLAALLGDLANRIENWRRVGGADAGLAVG